MGSNMLPTLLKIGPLSISSMGFLMVLSFLAATFLVWREARKEYLDEERVMDVFLISLVVGIIGARISFIILFPERFGVNVLRMLLPTWTPGFYLYGGIVTAFIISFFVANKKKVEFGKFLDAAIPGVIFGAALYKLGQFADGSLIGKGTELFFSLPVAGETGRFIPVPLLQAVLFFVLFIILTRIRKLLVVERKVTGALFLLGIVFASGIETAAFFLQRDTVWFGGMPISLVISVSAFLLSVVLFYKKMRSARGDFSALRSNLRSLLQKLTPKKKK